MRNEIEDLKQQAVEQAKQQLKNMAKESAKKVGQQIWFAIAPVLPYIIIALIIFIVIIGCIDWGEITASASSQGMTSASSSSWEQFKRFVLLNEGGTRVDENGNADPNGAYYIVEDDSEGNPTVGHGLCIYSYGEENPYLHEEAFANQEIDTKELVEKYNEAVANGYSSKNKEHYKYFPKVSVEICDAIWESNLKAIYEGTDGGGGLKSELSDLNLTTYQLYALTDVKYRRGNIKGFRDAYNNLWSDSENSYEENTSSEEYSMDTLYSFFNNGYTNTESGVYSRKQRQWLLFKYGYYEGLGEYWISAPDAADISSLATRDYRGTYQSTTGGYTFVEYYQSGASWSDDHLTGGSSNFVTIGNSGCHATSMAIALTAVTGETITPRDVNNAFNFMINDDIAILNTTTFSYLRDSVNISGLITSGLNKDFLISNLNAGNILLIRFQGFSEWTSSTHYVICADYKKEDGVDYVYISNPARYGASGWVKISRVTINQWTQARIISQK